MSANACKDCPDRYPACSAHCPKYAEYRAELDKKKEYLNMARDRNYPQHNRPFLHKSKSARERH